LIESRCLEYRLNCLRLDFFFVVVAVTTTPSNSSKKVCQNFDEKILKTNFVRHTSVELAFLKESCIYDETVNLADSPLMDVAV
jgi:hypothetical protein